MAVKKYTKGKIKIHDTPIVKESIVLTDESRQFKENKPTSMWEFLKYSYDDFIDMLISSKFIGLLIPLVLVFAGAVILHGELWPEVEQKVLESEGYFDQGTKPLVEGDYIQSRQLYLSDPGAEYFKLLTDEAQNQDLFQDDLVSRNYNGSFSISIPSINLYNLTVTANVDSGLEEEYQRILATSLAHMSGTGLPISDVDNNIVIYGHSARGNYYDRTQDPAGAFSRLQKVGFGDKITINIEGKDYKFKVYKTRIVQPNDTSIIQGSSNKRTLTLFTCYPLGNPSKRLVVVARPEINN